MESNFFLELLKYSIPALVVFAVSYTMLRLYLQKEYRLKQIELKMAGIREARPVRFQAYERIALLLERIALNNILHRVRKADMTVRDFQLAILSNIRSEFDHNVTQQIYVSMELWSAVKAAKEEVVSIVNRVASELPPNAPGIELSKRIFAHLIDSEERTPTQRALDQLKREIMELY
jgi:hypothetical protein